MTADSALAELAYRKPRVILFAGDPRAHNPRHRRCRCAGHRVGRLSRRRPRRPRRLGGDLRRGGGPAGTAVSQSQLSHSAVFPALRPRAERAPGLKALATSRGALRIRGEKVVAVAPLGDPGAGEAARPRGVDTEGWQRASGPGFDVASAISSCKNACILIP